MLPLSLARSPGSVAQQTDPEPQARGPRAPLPRHLHACERPAHGCEGLSRQPEWRFLSCLGEEGLEQGPIGVSACLVWYVFFGVFFFFRDSSAAYSLVHKQSRVILRPPPPPVYRLSSGFSPNQMRFYRNSYRDPTHTYTLTHTCASFKRALLYLAQIAINRNICVSVLFLYLHQIEPGCNFYLDSMPILAACSLQI